MDCNDYIKDVGCFAGVADLTYHVKNVGATCHNLDGLFTSLNFKDRRLLPFECNWRQSCPNDEFEWTEKRYIEPCTNGVLSIDLDIETDNLLGITLQASHPFENSTPPTVPAPAPTPPLNNNAPTYVAPEPISEAPGPESVDTCTSRPDLLKFKFFPDFKCARNNNNQFEQFGERRYLRSLKHKDEDKKDKDNKESSNMSNSPPMSSYYCQQHATLRSEWQWYSLKVSSIDGKAIYYDEKICSDTEFIVGTQNKALPEELKFEVFYSNELVQTVVMNSSCRCSLGDLKIGHIFGSFELVNFNEL